MRFAPALVLALTVALPAGAGEAGPGEGRITAMAQRLVFEHLDLPPERRFDFAFDIATLHPQPEPGYWAVVGGFAMNHGGSDYRRHVYVAAVRLVCKETADPACWRLEKLAVDNRLLLDRPVEQPL